MRGALAFSLALVLALGAPMRATAAPKPAAREFLRGADVSSLPQVEAGGATFRLGAKPADAIAVLKANGINAARLRLWHSPADGACGLDSTIAMARRLKQAGIPLLLDIQYSDTWADPAQQHKPAAWGMLSFPVLCDSVRTYTRDVITAFRLAGVSPASVQLGNEIGNGLLWPEGRIDRDRRARSSWTTACALLVEAANGAREGAAGQPLRLLVHFAGGGDPVAAVDFFEHMQAGHVPFDVIALSYYPWWHGSLDALTATLSRLHWRFGIPVQIVEAAYPWSLGWWDDVHNVVGSPQQLVEGYPATPQGQRDFMRTLLDRVRKEPGCEGVYYWEPAWVSSPRAGSSWENVALFDSSGTALPALKEFGRKK